MNKELEANTTLSHYRIVSKIGAGGMGEVYLAQDTKLDRQVALKILLPEFASDAERMRRFVQEAKSAAALTHPNIATIHEIGESEGVNFIAMEFIDGATLRQQLNARHTKIAQALDIGVQIAAALSAAHATGIIHRDIKPENVMIRRDGVVKVLDFGLAKLSEQADIGTVDAEAITKALVQTEPGVVLGTAAYMSPEQSRGLAVDARTDIFSLGVVIYEMVAGRAPFGGATRSDLIVALLERDPPPLARFTPEAPAELERLVMKTLAKDREERYQTAKDLLIDLKRLRQKLDVEAEIERAAAPERNDVATANKAPGTTANAAIESINTQAGTARPTSSAEYLISEIKRHKKGVAIIFAALVVAFAALGYGLYEFTSHRRPATSLPADKMRKLTTSGKVFTGLISPDGKHVVYVVDDAGQQSIWVRQVATTSNVQIVPPSEATYANFRFTSDGNYLYFNKRDKNGPDSLYQMPALGGMERKISENVSSRATLSPDGNRIAFIRGGPFEKENSLVVANSDGSGEQALTTRKGPDNFAGGIAWPPDGKSITCVAGEHAKKLIEVPLDGGAEKLVKTPKWFAIGSIEWLPDASGLIVTALEQSQSSRPQIWHLSYPSGEARRITKDFSGYTSLSLTTDASTLAAITREVSSNIWVAPGGDASRAIQLTTGTGRQDGNPAVNWTPDGKIVYDSTASGSRHPWIMNADGGDQRQLTDGSFDDQGAHVSHDGRYIVFASNRTGTFHIYRMDIDGNNLKQLTNGAGEWAPSFSPDGRWVICSVSANGTWKVPAEGGELMQLTKDSLVSAMSSDGKLLVNVRSSGAGPLLWSIIIMPFEGGPPLKTFDVASESRPSSRWAPDGRAIIYSLTHGGVLSGVTNLWIQPLDGGPPKQLTNFTSGTFFSFDWSPDGRRLAYGRGTTSSDVVLISDFR